MKKLIVEIFLEPKKFSLNPFGAKQSFFIYDLRNFWGFLHLLTCQLESFFDKHKEEFNRHDFKEIWRVYMEDL